MQIDTSYKSDIDHLDQVHLSLNGITHRLYLIYSWLYYIFIIHSLCMCNVQLRTHVLPYYIFLKPEIYCLKSA